MDIYIFAAFSGTGKTTYLEKLIPHLKGYGLRVAVLKHDAHDFAAVTPGKDSWRFAQAGADAVAVSSDRRTAMFYQHSLSVEELLSRLPEVDIVLTEGYKHGPLPQDRRPSQGSRRGPCCRPLGVYRLGDGRRGPGRGRPVPGLSAGGRGAVGPAAAAPI